jgi:iron complex outermembrane receptor protein
VRAAVSCEIATMARTVPPIRRSQLATLIAVTLAGASAHAAPRTAAADSAPATAKASPAVIPPPKADFTLDRVFVRGLQATSLPTRIPTTVEGVTHDEIVDRVNATDAQDALKYLPSLLVRKRYIGDYDHAVLATRASGTGNSARSLVYADGVLLSNLLGNGATFTPRWGLVNPEEIERVDVLYGPFSAAYSGNSVGAVVDYVTRMPEHFEAHAKLGYSTQRMKLYATDDRFDATTASASIGNRWGRFAAWLSTSRLDSESQPVAFATLLAASGRSGMGTPVRGAVLDTSPTGKPWYIVGATGQVDTVQTQAKLKLAYDIAPDLRLSYVFGAWNNDVFRDANTYLTDANGAPVYSGDVSIDGRRYTLAPTAISQQKAELAHRMHGLALKKHGKGRWDYSLSASAYDYQRDTVRSPLLPLPLARDGGAGRIADAAGTGWRTLDAMLTWRPSRAQTVEFGAQDEHFDLRTRVSGTSDWLRGAAETPVSAFGGTTELRGVFAQDTWTVNARWSGMLGARLEHWSARDGYIADATHALGFARRSESTLSPKAAIKYAPGGDWSLKGSIGRAVRFPTVSELYQGSIATNAVLNNDPDLKPERSITSELSWVRNVALGKVRATYFHEQTRDALYAQTNVLVTPNVTSIQNVEAIRTNGLELATELTGVGVDALDITASATFTDSIIVENSRLPASVGQWQPRVPRWRGNLVAQYHPGEHWSVTGALRYSGRQFNTLDNSDTHSHTYTGTSPFLVADMRVRYRHDAHVSAALGIDNLTNATYWNFHPYTQRTWSMEMRYDY